MAKKVFLDNASTTYTSSEVIAEMMPCFNSLYGNSSSNHSFGREAEAIVDRARDRISRAIGSKKSNEIYFTSSGTEANNLAILGIARANKNKGNHVITSKIEHDSVLEPFKQLEKEGFEVTYLEADKYGFVSLANLLHHIRDNTILISVMSVNNEIGTIQNIRAIAKTAHENGIIFHTDATCALGSINLNVEAMEIDALTMSAHKIYGPKGVGALYVKNGIIFESLIKGGEHERGKRAGSLNVPAIAGFGKAVELATRDMTANAKKLKAVKRYFLNKLTQTGVKYKTNGYLLQSVYSIVSLTFPGIDGEALMMLLDMEGIAVSTGSACASHATKSSHVLKAIRMTEEDSKSTIRVSFNKSITKDEIKYATDKIAECVDKLSKISPIYKPKEGRK